MVLRLHNETAGDLNDRYGPVGQGRKPAQEDNIMKMHRTVVSAGLTATLALAGWSTADTTDVSSVEVGIVSGFYCCSQDYFYADSTPWVIDCSVNPYGCAHGKDSAIWRFDLSELAGATVHSAGVSLEWSGYCSGSADIGYEPVSGPLDNSVAHAIANSPAESRTASLGYSPNEIQVGASVMADAIEMGGLAVYLTTDYYQCQMSGSVSMTIDYTPADTQTCPSDVSGDGEVGTTDLLILLADWGPCSGHCKGDLDGDGTIGTNDLLGLIAAWGVCEG